VIEQLFPQIADYFLRAIASPEPPTASDALWELGALYPAVGPEKFYEAREFVGAIARYAYGEELRRHLTECRDIADFRDRAAALAARTPWFSDSEAEPVYFARAVELPNRRYARTLETPPPGDIPSIVAPPPPATPPEPEPRVERYDPPRPAPGQNLLMPAIDVKASTIWEDRG